MSGERASARRVLELREMLSGRDIAIVRQVADLTHMSSLQIERLHFDPSEHASALAAARACRRSLEWLSSERLLIRLDRRIGGIRAGSASFVYAIGPVGERVLDLPTPRHRFREPSLRFLKHTLAVSQLVVDITRAARALNGPDIVGIEPEPRCWRKVLVVSGSFSILRPDLFVSLGVGEFEHRWFIEVDLGSEHLPTLLRKCRAYEAYYRTGTEQAEHDVFPTVLWIMGTRERAERLRDAIDRDGGLTAELFVVTANELVVEVLIGATS